MNPYFEDINIKIMDFGLAEYFEISQKFKSMKYCGKRYDFQCVEFRKIICIENLHQCTNVFFDEINKCTSMYRLSTLYF